MYQYVYMSSEVYKFTEAQLKGLLELSRRKNGTCELTGLLLYLNGNFIQLLEGAKDHVLATRERIAADNRHRGMNTLHEGPCEKRDFQDWSMGFERLEGPEAETIPGYSDFLSIPAGDPARQSAALRLLEFFKRTAR